MKARMTKRRCAGLWAGAALAVHAHEAVACGGVFAPPQSAQVVTDNSMVLSISARQTTLWTQPRYAGRAADFSWVFPLRYTEGTRFSLASDAFIPVTELLTAPSIVEPTPAASSCERAADAGGLTDGPGLVDGGVSVPVMVTVGPYDVAVLRATDPAALRTWLQTNGYAVPTAIEPVLAHYVAQGLDFVAFRLHPGEGADRLPPIRVTMPGALMRLPLRMIAAGAGDHVRLRLVIFSQGRVEAANFPNGELTDADLVWDWSSPPDPSAAFAAAFQRLNARNGGRLWLTETARGYARPQWEYTVMRAWFGPPDAGVDDGGAPDAGPVARASALDDVALAFDALGDEAVVTRLTADLATTLLDRDLDLAASTAGDRPALYRYGTELHRPAAPTCGPAAPDAGCSCRAARDDRPATRGLVASLCALSAGLLARRAARSRERP